MDTWIAGFPISTNRIQCTPYYCGASCYIIYLGTVGMAVRLWMIAQAEAAELSVSRSIGKLLQHSTEVALASNH